jgi:hypothetical protein
MHVEKGKYYRDGNGRVIGPLMFTGDGEFLHLVAEVYVSDTPPPYMRFAATSSDDTDISFNLSELAREGRDWIAGDVGFWIGDEAHKTRNCNHQNWMGGMIMQIEAQPTTSTTAEAAQAKAEGRLLLEENEKLRDAINAALTEKTPMEGGLWSQEPIGPNETPAEAIKRLIKFRVVTGCIVEREQLQAEIEKLRAALRKIADTDPDEGTSWFHDVANAALGEKE